MKQDCADDIHRIMSQNKQPMLIFSKKY